MNVIVFIVLFLRDIGVNIHEVSHNIKGHLRGGVSSLGALSGLLFGGPYVRLSSGDYEGVTGGLHRRL